MTRETARDELNNQQRGEEETDRLAFIGTLAEGLAHEIRNPLSTINVDLQLLKEDWEPPETEREKNSYERIKRLLEEIDHLEEVLNHFLQFAGGLDLQLEDLDINTYLEKLFEFLRPEFDPDRVELELNFEQGLPLVSIDRDHFRQPLINILQNAREALEEEGGTISVSTEETDEGEVLITISDNGKGIPTDKLENVSEVYYSTKKGQTGLGLPIASRIVQEHGGYIDIESEEGSGTHVHLYLPPADSERA